MESSSKVIHESDILAKYAMRKKELRSSGKIKGGLLSPKLGESLSLFEVNGLTHAEVCEHGRKYVDRPSADPSKNRVHIGYCLFTVKCFQKFMLEVVYDNDPDRHVSIYFPNDLSKAKLLGKQLEAECICRAESGRENVYFNECLPPDS